MDAFDDLKLSDSEDDEGAGERVRMIMEEIYKNQDKIKSEKDIEEMAERCTNMMTQMRNEAYTKKKEKKGQRSSGAGDKASPPPSRLSSVKESPRKDSTKSSGSPLFPPPTKSSLKPPMDYKKKSQKPNFSELYKEKMEKMRVPGKIDLKGTHTKTDSTKASKAKMGMGDSRRRVEEDSNDSESESSSMNSESDSIGSDELQKILDSTKSSDKIMKEFKARESYRGVGKEVDAHRKTADWMSSTRGELAKKKEAAGSSKMAAAKANQNMSFFSSSDMDSEDEKIAQQLKSKMTLSSKKPPSDNKEATRKLLSSISEKPKGVLPTKAPAATARRPSVPAAAAPKVAVSRPGPAEKAKPRKKMEEAMRKEPVLWGLTRNSSTKLDEAHFKDALNKMKESGVSLKGSEGEPSVDRIIKTIAEEESSEESLSGIYNYDSSKDSDDSDREVPEEEKLAAEKLLKELKEKKEQPMRARDISELRRPYMSWLEKERSSLRLAGRTTTDGVPRVKSNKKYGDTFDILSDESVPSEGSTVSSDVESDPNDPFSQTQEGKEIMKKMNKINPGKKKREKEREAKEAAAEGSGFRPYLDASSRPPPEWCALARAQAESRAQKQWTDGVVKDIDSMWIRDICEASERERRARGGEE